MPRPRARPLFELGGQWIAREPGRIWLYRFWTESGTGRTRRASLGTTDLEVAKRALAVIHVKGQPKTVEARLSAVLITYFEDQTDKLPSHKVARGHGRKLLAFFGDGVRVKELTDAKQKKFVEHCLEQGLKLSYIARVMTTLSAALRLSKLSEPEIISTEKKMVKKWKFTKTKPKKARIPTDDECAEILLCGRVPERFLRWCIIQAFNGGRPQTAVDLTPAQFNKDSEVVDLLPPDREQIEKKYRSTVKAARTFRLLLRSWERKGLDAFGGRYCGYSSMEGVKSAIERIAAVTGIPVSSYSMRHKVTSIMRKARTAEDQVAGVLGHKRPDLRTTGEYGDYDPDYQKEAADAMEAWFWKVVKLTRKLKAERANSHRTPKSARPQKGRVA